MSKQRCKHCGTAISFTDETEAFCCSGCEQVYRLIRSEGLDLFYELQIGVGRPVGELDIEAGQFEWVKPYQSEIEAAGGDCSMYLKISGMSCFGCIWLIEHLFKRIPGGKRIQVNLEEHRIYFNWKPGEFEVRAFLELLGEFGYHASPFRSSMPAFWSPLTWRLLLCAAFAMNAGLLALPNYLVTSGFVYSGLFSLLSLLFALLSLLVGGSYFIVPSVRSMRAGIVHYDLLCALGLVFMPIAIWQAGSIRDLWKWSFIIFVLLGGRWLHIRLHPGEVDGLSDSAFTRKLYVWMQVYVFGVLALVLFVCTCLSFIWAEASIHLAVSAFLAGAWYPIMRSADRQLPNWFLLVGVLLCFSGVLFSLFELLGPVSAVGWMLFSGVCWQRLGALVGGEAKP